MLWVAGGKCVIHRHRITATAAPRLTLPYLKLVYSISILLFITLDYHILDCQSNAKTHNTLIFPSRTEVRSRGFCDAGPLLGLKIASVRPAGAQETLGGLVFQAHNGLKCHPMRSKCLIGHIHTSCHAQTMESLVLLWDNSHFSMLKHTKHSFSPAKRR